MFCNSPDIGIYSITILTSILINNLNYTKREIVEIKYYRARVV